MQHNTQPIHILIAEDQETDAFFVEQAFSQSKIANIVYRVKDGQGVLDFLGKAGRYKDEPRPNIIFLDINMPGKNGLDVLSVIKKSDNFCDIPVVMISASQDDEDMVRAYKHHANAFVPKSNGFEDMKDFVSAIEKFWFLKARLPGNDA